MHRWTRVSTRSAALALLGAVALLGASPSWSQVAAVRSPDTIRAALDTMSRVVDESERLIAAHQYDQLPRESNEFEAGLTALDQGLRNRPSALRSKLEPLVGKARIASSAMREAVQAHRDSMLSLAHHQLADAVSEIIAAFPPEMRPPARTR